MSRRKVEQSELQKRRTGKHNFRIDSGTQFPGLSGAVQIVTKFNTSKKTLLSCCVSFQNLESEDTQQGI
jgi:hypothetical protein